MMDVFALHQGAPKVAFHHPAVLEDAGSSTVPCYVRLDVATSGLRPCWFAFDAEGPGTARHGGWIGRTA